MSNLNRKAIDLFFSIYGESLCVPVTRGNPDRAAVDFVFELPDWLSDLFAQKVAGKEELDAVNRSLARLGEELSLDDDFASPSSDPIDAFWNRMTYGPTAPPVYVNAVWKSESMTYPGYASAKPSVQRKSREKVSRRLERRGAINRSLAIYDESI
jgi:hypothetical protein